jgi:hypothetical protein
MAIWLTVPVWNTPLCLLQLAYSYCLSICLHLYQGFIQDFLLGGGSHGALPPSSINLYETLSMMHLNRVGLKKIWWLMKWNQVSQRSQPLLWQRDLHMIFSATGWVVRRLWSHPLWHSYMKTPPTLNWWVVAGFAVGEPIGVFHVEPLKVDPLKSGQLCSQDTF